VNAILYPILSYTVAEKLATDFQRSTYPDDMTLLEALM
jgi:hypothetical protein